MLNPDPFSILETKPETPESDPEADKTENRPAGSLHEKPFLKEG